MKEKHVSILNFDKEYNKNRGNYQLLFINSDELFDTLTKDIEKYTRYKHGLSITHYKPIYLRADVVRESLENMSKILEFNFNEEVKFSKDKMTKLRMKQTETFVADANQVLIDIDIYKHNIKVASNTYIVDYDTNTIRTFKCGSDPMYGKFLNNSEIYLMQSKEDK